MVLSLASCSQNEPTSKDQKEEQEFQFDPAYSGYYLENRYIQLLSKTKSTKKAHGEEGARIFVVTKSGYFIPMSLHEGANEYKIRMTSDSTGIVKDLDDKLSFVDQGFLSNKQFFKKAPKSSLEGVDQLINDQVISGKYLYNGKEVSFESNGVVLGLEGIKSYRLWTDYIGAGLNEDLISFNEEEFQLIYAWEKDTLKLYSKKCILPEDDFCIEIAKDSLFGVFVPIK